jgi:hypothetical protein
VAYPANQLELIESFGIPRLSGPNGQAFIGCVFGAINDMIVEATATLVRARMLYDVNPRTPDEGDEQPLAAIQLLGQEAHLPLYPGETHASLVTQLRRKWDHYSGGAKAALESELVRAGYDATVIVPGDEDLTPVVVTAGTMGAATGSQAISITSAALPGDLLLLAVETANEPITAPEGWDEIVSVGVGAPGGDGTRLQIFWREMSLGLTTVTLEDAGDHTMGRVIVVNGAELSSIDASIATSADADVTAVSCDASNAELPQSLMILIVANGADVSGANISGQANAELAGISERGDNNSATGNGGGLSVTTGARAAAGSGGTWTATLANAARWAACSLTLVPLQYWSRFKVQIENSPLIGPGLSWGAHRVGLDVLGPFGGSEQYFGTLRSIVARNKPIQWIPWEYHFPLADASGTVRIRGSIRTYPDPVYFS